MVIDQNTLIILVVLAVIVLLLIIWMAMRKRRSDTLREKFGDEYDRTIEVTGKRSAAEAELQERQKRVAQLDIHPLTVDDRDRFTGEWRDVKALFVDSPVEAVLHADRLMAEVMKTKGYPMADFERRYADLTVDHPDVARHYRDGHSVVDRFNRGEANTEDMRQAMQHFEALFDKLTADAVEPMRDRPDSRSARPA